MWRFEVYSDRGGHYRWRLFASNGRNVASSGESFASQWNAKNAAENFKQHARAWKYDVYPDASGQYRWRAKAGNGQVVAVSGESFYSASNARESAHNVAAHAGGATGL